MTRSQLATLLMSFFAFGAVAARADSVSGGVTGKDKQFTPSHVAAFNDGHGIMVILTADAVDATNIAKASRTDFEFTYMNDPAVHSKDSIVLGVDGKNIVSMNATLDGVQNVDSSGKIFGEQGTLTARCTANTKERIACHVSRPENPNPGQKKWTLDVDFDSVPVRLARQ